MLRWPSTLVRPLLLTLTATMLAACAAQASEPSPSPEPPTPTPVEYTAVMQSAREAMDDVTSFRWESEYEANGTGEAPPFRAKYEGVWSDGDLEYIATYFVEGDPIVQRNRYVDGRTFRRIEGGWEERGELVPTGLPAWDDRSPVPQVDRGQASADAAGNWLVEGTRVFESQTTDWTITYDVTALIDDEDKRLINTTVETTASNGDTSRTTIEFSDYNGPSAVPLPESPAVVP